MSERYQLAEGPEGGVLRIDTVTGEMWTLCEELDSTTGEPSFSWAPLPSPQEAVLSSESR